MDGERTDRLIKSRQRGHVSGECRGIEHFQETTIRQSLGARADSDVARQYSMVRDVISVKKSLSARHMVVGIGDEKYMNRDVGPIAFWGPEKERRKF